MKKNLIVFLIFSLFALQLYAQKNKRGNNRQANNDEYVIQQKIFEMALKYNDIDEAKHALYKMIVLNPTNNSLKDSLAVLYFKLGFFTQCILASTDIVKNNPDNVTILQLKAISEISLGFIKDAIDDYEKLYKLSKNVLHLYQLALLQYQLKRFVECNLSIEQLFAHPETDKQTINITTEKGSRQIVPLKAAVWNLKGVVFMDMNENDKTKKYFSEALKIFPDFELAKGNLKFLENKMKEKK